MTDNVQKCTCKCPIHGERPTDGFTYGFKRGRNSILRKNQSGCCCIISDDTDEVLSPCGAHEEWKGKPKPKWFTTDKPLPDGDYGWRLHEGSFERPVKIYNEIIYQLIVDHKGNEVVYKSKDFSRGEFCKIKFLN